MNLYMFIYFIYIVIYFHLLQFISFIFHLLSFIFIYIFIYVHILFQEILVYPNYGEWISVQEKSKTESWLKEGHYHTYS